MCSHFSPSTTVKQMNDDITYLRETIDISHDSRSSGNHPFGALLFDSKGDVITSSGNTLGTDKGIGHAELNVAKIAAVKFPVAFLEVNQTRVKILPCRQT